MPQTFAGPRGWLTIGGSSFEALALQEPLPFSPPMASRGFNQNGFQYYWKLLNYVFHLPDPAAFPPLGCSVISDDENTSIGRYVGTCRDIATSAVTNCNAKLSISPGRLEGEETLVKDLPSRENIIGFAGLWRQLNSVNEHSSFSTVRKIIGQANHRLADSAAGSRLEILKAWQHCENKLKGGSLLSLVGEKLSAEGRWNSSMTPHVHDLTPRQLITLYMSGDWMHWGEERESLTAFKADPTLAKLRDFDVLIVMLSFAHVYMGFAELLTNAFSGVILGERR